MESSEDIRRRAETVRREWARLLEVADKLEEAERETYHLVHVLSMQPIGQIITWDKEFKGSEGKVYNYMAIKNEGGWYVSGLSAHKCRTDGNLVDFILQHVADETDPMATLKKLNMRGSKLL
jgi:hypothetical protein